MTVSSTRDGLRLMENEIRRHYGKSALTCALPCAVATFWVVTILFKRNGCEMEMSRRGIITSVFLLLLLVLK